MQLKIQRSQRASNTNVIIFCLDIRADYSAEEADNIRRYRLGPQGIYSSRAATRHLDAAGRQLERTQEGDLKNRAAGLVKGAVSMALSKMHLNVTIASLAKGHHIECKDLEELLEAEDTLRNACKNLTRYLEVANTFNGSEVVVDYVNGEEQVHIAQNVPPLLEYQQPQLPATENIRASAAQPERGPAQRVPEAKSSKNDLLLDRIVSGWQSFEVKFTAFLNDRPMFTRSGMTLDRRDARVIYIAMLVVLFGLIFILG